MVDAKLSELVLPYDLKKYEAYNLIVESSALNENPLGDPARRSNYILVPKKSRQNQAVIFHLAGYFSTGYQMFSSKTLELNFPQNLDRLLAESGAGRAIHVFVDASTYWGGSQFINSPGSGRYQDYILKELFPSVTKLLPCDLDRTCVMGGSSGGYGALSLVSQKNSPFRVAFATAPDSLFEVSLLPDLYKAAPELSKYKNFRTLKKMIGSGDLQGKRSFFNLVNIIAMAHCYAPKDAFEKDWMEWPIDLYSGEINQSLWKQWLKHDPVRFLKKRLANLKSKTIALDVGKYDDYALQYGTRQIFDFLQKSEVESHYSEFPGNHFGLSARRLKFLFKLPKYFK